jgi:organic radical activating enzyme
MRPSFLAPLYAIWELTRNCNFNCKYCVYPKRNDKFTPLPVLIKALKNMQDSKYRFDLDLMGGEPTIHPNYIDILEESLKRLPNSNVYTTTNVSKNLDFFRAIDDRVNRFNYRTKFYFSYHSERTDPLEFVKKVDFLGDRGYAVYIKFICETNDFDKIKSDYEILKNSNHSKFFIKYLWGYRETGIYSEEYLEWMKDRTIDNNYFFNIEYLDDDNTNRIAVMNYEQIKSLGFDQLKDYYCYVYRLLYIDVFGEIYSSCLKSHGEKSVSNIYLKHIDFVFDKFQELKKCKHSECTELFNNPIKLLEKIDAC